MGDEGNQDSSVIITTVTEPNHSRRDIAYHFHPSVQTAYCAWRRYALPHPLRAIRIGSIRSFSLVLSFLNLDLGRGVARWASLVVLTTLTTYLLPSLKTSRPPLLNLPLSLCPLPL